MLSDDIKRQLDLLLDGDLADEDQTALLQTLETDPAAIEWLADRALLHSHLRRAMQRRSIQAESLSAAMARESDLTQLEVTTDHGRRRFSVRRLVAAVSLVVIAATAMLYGLVQPEDRTFATLGQTRAALWESSDLLTEDGSRLARGTLRLFEGLATVHFDSGAKVTLEAPATLVLTDAMNCELTHGTAVSDIPDSALGFRIKTPSASVVDYGTRFAVSVYAETGETRTRVIEGRVQVEYAQSDQVVELNTGQRNTVVGEALGEPTDVTRHEYQTISLIPVDRGPDWTLLKPVKDAYTGHVGGHDSQVLLLVKKAIKNVGVSRISYIGFDLSAVDRKHIAEAELMLCFVPTGWGLASHVPDATFSVYGMTSEVPEWDESILHGHAFPGSPDLVHLGSFSIPQGVQKGHFRVHTDELSRFLQTHEGPEVTLKIVRDTCETDDGGLVHGFASRRHPVLPAPTLAIRTSIED